LHLVGFLLILNYHARNNELKIRCLLFPGLPSGLCPSEFPPKPLMHLSCLSFMSRSPAISFLSVRLHADYNNFHNKRTNAILNRTHMHAHAHTHPHTHTHTHIYIYIYIRQYPPYVTNPETSPFHHIPFPSSIHLAPCQIARFMCISPPLKLQPQRCTPEELKQPVPHQIL